MRGGVFSVPPLAGSPTWKLEAGDAAQPEQKKLVTEVELSPIDAVRRNLSMRHERTRQGDPMYAANNLDDFTVTQDKKT